MSYEPKTSKTISADEYSIFDPNALFFFHLMSHDDKTAIDIRDRWVGHIKETKNKTLPAKKRENLLKVTKTNLKELFEVNIIESDQDNQFSFDTNFLTIIEIIHDHPSTNEGISIALKSRSIDVPQTKLLEYLNVLEGAEYIRKTIKILHDKNYSRIIEIIRKQPLTVKELESEFNTEVSKKDSKSENTIYRYLNTLKAAQLVVPAGQRVKFGKTATETLYNISAKIFFTPQMTADDWRNKMGQHIVEIMSTLFMGIPERIRSGDDCIRSILINITSSLEAERDSLIENVSVRTLEELSHYSTHEINAGFRNAGLVLWFLKHPEKIKEITECLRQTEA